jgi:ABC-type amino acid transport substrate-binding protein
MEIRMKHELKVVLGALLASLVLAGPALGQNLDGTLKKIKTSGTLTIGYRESSPPFSFMGPASDRGILIGLAVTSKDPARFVPAEPRVLL